VAAGNQWYGFSYTVNGYAVGTTLRGAARLGGKSGFTSYKNLEYHNLQSTHAVEEVGRASDSPPAPATFN